MCLCLPWAGALLILQPKTHVYHPLDNVKWEKGSIYFSPPFPRVSQGCFTHKHFIHYNILRRPMLFFFFIHICKKGSSFKCGYLGDMATIYCHSCPKRTTYWYTLPYGLGQLIKEAKACHLHMYVMVKLWGQALVATCCHFQGTYFWVVCSSNPKSNTSKH